MFNRQVIYKKIAFILSILVFYSSVGLAVDLHFCQGEVKSMAFFGKAKNCYELAGFKNACPKHESITLEKNHLESIKSKKCCTSKSILLQSDSDQLIPSVDVNPTQVFLFAFSSVFLLNHEELDAEYTGFYIYKPPLVYKDIPVLFENFRL